MKTILLAATFFCFVNLTNGQAGRLDPSFGKNGIVKTDIGEKYSYTRYVRQVLSLPDEACMLLKNSKACLKGFRMVL